MQEAARLKATSRKMNAAEEVWGEQVSSFTVQYQKQLQFGDKKIKNKQNTLVRVRILFFVAAKDQLKSVFWNLTSFVRSEKVGVHWFLRGQKETEQENSNRKEVTLAKVS